MISSPTQPDSLSERRRWFRHFPEGSAEFLLVTRVMALGLMLLLAVVHSTQAIAVATAVIVILWVDHLLMIWWTIQISSDLDDMDQPSPPAAATSRLHRAKALAAAACPLVAALPLLAPWDRLVFGFESTRAAAMRIVVPILMLGFAAGLVAARRLIRTLRAGTPAWKVLLVIPAFHWLALQRILPGLEAEVEKRARRGGMHPHIPHTGTALMVANLAWLGSMATWGGYLALSLEIGGLSAPGMKTACALFGTLLAVFLMTAQLAAIEHVQRRFVELLRG